MKLALKKSFNRWVKVGKESEEFYIDYPSIEQDQALQTILFSDEYTGSDRMLKYAQAYLKYVIKDWKNVNDESGPVKCKIVDNELDKELWWALVSDQTFVSELFIICKNELDFTESDKKKLSLQDSFSEKES